MKRLLHIFITALLIVTTSAINQKDPKAYYKNGIQKLENNNYIQAIGEFTNAISLNPDYAEAYVKRAKAKQKMGEKIGFSNDELCFDLIKGMKLGNQEAIDMIKENCMSKCYGMENAFNETEAVFCADFSSKVLKSLPDKTKEMENLVRLNLFNNKLTHLSKDFSKLNSLVELDMSSNKIETVNPAIGKLENLKELNINKNYIKTLPEEFGNLNKLEYLYLRSNYLEKLPKSIARLKSLKKLDLSLNKLKTLPMEITNLKNLETLNLVGNEIPKKNQKIIKELLPDTKIYFE